MIEITFSDKEISQLQTLQAQHPHHIARIADVSENTVRTCFEAYQKGARKSAYTQRITIIFYFSVAQFNDS